MTARRPRTEPSPPSQISLPRRRAPAQAGAARRRQQRQAGTAARAHGWTRASDGSGPAESAGRLVRRRADGTPLLLCTALAVLTGVGLARVEARTEVLDIANEITELSEEQQTLLDRKRRLETERAYLRRPQRVREQASGRLGMLPAAPERIQRIELKPAPVAEQEPTP